MMNSAPCSRVSQPRVMLRLIALMMLVSGCAQPLGGPASAALTGTDWELTELQGVAPAVGAGGRRATIRLDADASRVAGFAGCNRYFGTYTLDGATLRFGAIGMTRMACAEGMTLEQQLSAALDATRRYEVRDREFSRSVDASERALVAAIAVVVEPVSADWRVSLLGS